MDLPWALDVLSLTDVVWL